MPASRKAFQLQAIDSTTRCFACRKDRPAKEWLCKCGKPWFLCPEHRHAPTRTRSMIKRLKEVRRERYRRTSRRAQHPGGNGFIKDARAMSSKSKLRARNFWMNPLRRARKIRKEKKNEEGGKKANKKSGSYESEVVEANFPNSIPDHCTSREQTKTMLSKEERSKRKFESVSFSSMQPNIRVKGSFLSNNLRAKFGHIVASDVSCCKDRDSIGGSSGSACLPYLTPVFSNSVVAQLYLKRHMSAEDNVGESKLARHS